MLRISTTLVEQFRRWKYTEFTDSDKEQEAQNRLIASIKGEPFQRTRPMALGIAFDEILQDPARYLYPAATEYRYSIHDEWAEFRYEDVQKALPLFPDGVWQVKDTKLYTLNHIVELVAKADMLFADTVIENKTAWSSFDYDSYAQSYQWRYYLDVFGANQCHYNVFQFYDGAGGIVLKDIHEFSFMRYDTMHNDCHYLLSEFISYLEMKGLIPYLMSERLTKAVA